MAVVSVCNIAEVAVVAAVHGVSTFRRFAVAAWALMGVAPQ